MTKAKELEAEIAEKDDLIERLQQQNLRLQRELRVRQRAEEAEQQNELLRRELHAARGALSRPGAPYPHNEGGKTP